MNNKRITMMRKYWKGYACTLMLLLRTKQKKNKLYVHNMKVFIWLFSRCFEIGSTANVWSDFIILLPLPSVRLGNWGSQEHLDFFRRTLGSVLFQYSKNNLKNTTWFLTYGVYCSILFLNLYMTYDYMWYKKLIYYNFCIFLFELPLLYV